MQRCTVLKGTGLDKGICRDSKPSEVALPVSAGFVIAIGNEDVQDLVCHGDDRGSIG
jgi:hypothetical protein